MEDRKRRVLQAIIDDYIDTGEPVGSRTVARKYGLGVSPATIRNEMADLEEMGYLEQPHSSAGRVPSDKGYRFYVDVLAGGPEPGAVDVEDLCRALTARAQHAEDVIRQATHLLAEMSRVVGVASQPAAPPGEHLAALQVVPLRERVALVLLVADDGRVATRLVEFPAPAEARQLELLGQELSRRLQGAPLGDIGERLQRALRDIHAPFLGLMDEMVGLLEESPGERSRIVFDGATNLLKQPEFREVTKANQVLEALEREDLLEERLGPPEEDTPGLEVSIGRELRIAEMAECSIVTAVYVGPGGALGRVGIVGPRRMPYRRIMALVAGVAEAVTMALRGAPPFRTYVPVPWHPLGAPDGPRGA
jgi:heat-inducible transcriptional repressor